MNTVFVLNFVVGVNVSYLPYEGLKLNHFSHATVDERVMSYLPYEGLKRNA